MKFGSVNLNIYDTRSTRQLSSVELPTSVTIGNSKFTATLMQESEMQQTYDEVKRIMKNCALFTVI